MTETIQCTKCKEELPLEFFTNSQLRKRWKKEQKCKECTGFLAQNVPFVFPKDVETLVCRFIEPSSKRALLVDRRDLPVTLIENETQITLEYEDENCLLKVTKTFPMGPDIWRVIEENITMLEDIEEEILCKFGDTWGWNHRGDAPELQLRQPMAWARFQRNITENLLLQRFQAHTVRAFSPNH